MFSLKSFFGLNRQSYRLFACRLCNINLPKERKLSSKKNYDSLPSRLRKYEPFREGNSPVILDVEEERHKIKTLENEVEEISSNLFAGISPQPGTSGVIDTEELVGILRRENAQDIFVAEVPPQYRYVQHIVLTTGKSARHLYGIASFIRSVYKYKVKGVGVLPVIEGKKSQDWIALDLGNIALHIFSKKKREEYDLESLWAVGGDLDRLVNQPTDPVIQLLKSHSEENIQSL